MTIQPQHRLALYLALFIGFLSFLLISNFDSEYNRNAATSFNQNTMKTNGFLLPKSLPLANVEFSSTSDTLKSTAGFANQWTLLALGYTQCPDVCPTTLMKLNQVVDALPKESQPRVAFLSIDITPDELNKLSDYMDYFNEEFVGLSTAKRDLDNFFKSLGASYSIQDSVDGRLSIEHSSAIYLISPDKQYVANFPYMLAAEEITQDYLMITAQQAI